MVSAIVCCGFNKKTEKEALRVTLRGKPPFPKGGWGDFAAQLYPSRFYGETVPAPDALMLNFFR